MGSTQKAWEEASAAVAAPYEELQHALAHQPVLNGDETGHRTNGAKRWLWTLVAPTFVFYTIAASRGADVLRRLLGDAFAGVLSSDRLPVYLTYAADRRQLCWAHFRRNLLSAQELATSAGAKRFCREALALQRQLFRLWHRFRGDPRTRGAPLTRAQLIAKVLPIEKRFFALAQTRFNAGDISDARIGGLRSRASIANYFNGTATDLGLVENGILLATGETLAQTQNRVLGTASSAALFTEAPGFFVLGARGGWRVTDRLEVTIIGENLTDRNYRLYGSGIDAPGINVQVRTRYRF